MTRSHNYVAKGFLFLAFTLLAVLAASTARADCTPPPTGIAGWWPAEGNANDIVGTNNGILESGVTFGPGMVGQGFYLNSTNAYVTIPASASLNIGTNGTGLTLEAWIYPTNVNAFHPIMEWAQGYTGGNFGVQIWLGSQPSDVGVLFVNVIDANGIYHKLESSQNAVAANQFQHVALTYDPVSGNATLYLNATVVAQLSIGTIIPETSYNLYLGIRLGDLPGYWTYGNYFAGILDEPGIYSRALSATEIQTIYNAGSAGKCAGVPIAPFITSQPANLTVTASNTAMFAVSAFGTAPLAYQWICNTTNVLNATNASLTLNNVQLAQAGNYSVLVTNLGGFILSSNALLTVSVPPPPSCTPPPAGIVGWWAAEGNAFDSIYGDNGTVTGGVSYATGEVGQAFLFNTTNAGIIVPANGILNVGTNSGLTLEAWIYPTAVTNAAQWLLGWNGTGYGTMLKLSQGPSSGQGAGCLFSSVIDTGGNGHFVSSAAGIVQNNVFQHVALTYDKASGVARIYLNGAIVAQQTVGSFTPQTTYPFVIGQAASVPPEHSFSGLMDEVSVYTRALATNEIAAIYNAGSYGKCAGVSVAPILVSQPTNLTVTVSNTAMFAVSAFGTAPLAYQWICNTTNVLNATNASLTLNNVQLAQAGNYSVLVTNLAGSVLSSNAVLTVSVPPPVCTPPAAGIAGWWPAESSGNDIIGGNNGTLGSGVRFGPGLVGQGFYLSNTNAYVTIPASTSLNLGANGTGLTLEAWIYPTNVNGFHNIMEWAQGFTGQNYGVNLWLGSQPSDVGVVQANVIDSNGTSHTLKSSQNAVSANQFQHVALTYDPASGNAIVYVNGTVVAQSNIGTVIPRTSYNLYLGRRLGDVPGAWTYGNYFAGILDEPSIYSRALSAAEIAAVYNASSAGKCAGVPIAPFITSQPTNLTVTVSNTAAFAVSALGTAPLAYQWKCNTTNLLNATNAILTLNNVQLSQAGNYSVLVTNLGGSVLSSNALLTVLPPVAPPSCTPPAAGVAGWWPAESSANDIIGANNGILGSGVRFGPGLVGQGFYLSNTNAYVTIPASASLNIGTNGTGLTLEAWIYPTNVNGFHFIMEWAQGTVGGNDGVDIVLGSQPSDVGVLSANVFDNNGNDHQVKTGQNAVTANKFQHVALTYDRVSGNAIVYVNGTVVAQSNIGTFIPQTSYNLYFGIRLGDLPGAWTYGNYFAGILDEPSIYSRALSGTEIAAVYNAGSAGKCQGVPIAPFITSQPTNLTVTVSNTAAFAVSALGSAPLAYQWKLNTTNLLNATNAILTLNNVQLPQAGNYSVLVTNLGGSVLSSNALLTVLPPVAPPSCTPPAAGVAGWWPAESSANDIIGANNGILGSGVRFGPGLVGQGFYLSNTNAYVTIPASASLNIGTNGTGLTLEAWIYPTNVNGFHFIMEWAQGTVGGNDGVDIVLGSQPSDVGVLSANVFDNNGNDHQVKTGQNAVTANKFQHVALTYDRVSGNAIVYVNGTVVAQSNIGTFIPQTSYNLYFGIRLGDLPGAWTYGNYFAGILDEPSIYSRALAGTEIVAVYNAGSAGKCFTPTAPVITAQPGSVTNLLGTTAAFSVSASSLTALSYQWAFNTTNILNATNATLVLTNVQPGQAGNYSVLVGNIVGSTNSAAAALTVVLPPVITRQPLSLIVPSYSSASFSVAAAGTGPLTYQWQKNGTNLVDNSNLSGSITTNLNLASVSLTDAGSYVVVVSSPYAATSSIPAGLTVPQTVFTLGSTNAMSGSTIVVPVWMNALGVESAFQASIGYDPTKLVLQAIQPGPATAGDYFAPVSYLTNNGYVGFAIYGATIPSGTDEVADLIFKCLPVTNVTTVNLTFGDVPVGRNVADHNLHLLPALFQGGSVILSPAEYEADVYPRFNGDGQVGFLDWLEVGRMVVGLDVPTNSDEFMRADCAPRNAPDGVLTVADWVQAGRYELGLDPLTLVTPPLTPNLASVATKATKAKPLDSGGPAPARILQIANVSAARGQTVNVPVQLVCLTGENAVGMTIGYNTNLLSFVNVLLGTNIPVTGAALNLNTNQPGKLGVALALSSGTALAAGTNEVAILQFTAGAGASGPANLTFDSTVVQMQVADYTANSLATIYVNGAVVLPPQPIMSILSAAGSGSQLQLTWPLCSGTFQVQTADSPLGPWTTVVFPMVTNGANVSVMVSPTNQYQFLRLQGQ